MNMNQVTLAVSDIDKASDFYRRMGFLQIVDSPRYARFECPEGNASFSLSLEETAHTNGATAYFETDKLDKLVKDLKSEGFEFDQDPTEMTYLWREAILHDPPGNKIKLYWAGENRLYPPWRVEKSS